MKVFPQKQNQFGSDNNKRCPVETENVIRANGPPNTPQVHSAAGSMIVGSIMWNEDWDLLQILIRWAKSPSAFVGPELIVLA